MTTVVRNEDPRHPVLREQVLLRARAFASLGYESVVLLCGVDPEQGVGVEDDELASVEVRHVRARGLPAFARAVRSAARASDVLVCRGATPTVVAIAASRLLRHPPRVVYDARGWIYGERLDNGDGPIVVRLHRAVERYAFRHADRVVAPAQSLLGIAAAAGAAPEKLALIPQLPSAGPGGAEGASERTIDVVYVGTEQAVYQPHDEIRELLTRLAEELPELAFEWLDGKAGAEPERIRPNLVRVRLELGEVGARLGRARVGLIIRGASRSNLAAAPTKAAQYIAAGCRVVSGPDPPAVAEWALTGAGALVVDPRRPQSWAAGIRKATESPRSPTLDLAALGSLWDRVLADQA